MLDIAPEDAAGALESLLCATACEALGRTLRVGAASGAWTTFYLDGHGIEPETEVMVQVVVTQRPRRVQ